MSRSWLNRINRDNPSWSDIGRLLNVSYICNTHERERKVLYEWISGVIRASGPHWVYQNRDVLKREWVGIIKPKWEAQWAKEDREQRRKAGRKGGEEKLRKPRKKKKGFLTYKSSSPKSHGIISRALWRKK